MKKKHDGTVNEKLKKKTKEVKEIKVPHKFLFRKNHTRIKKKIKNFI